VEAVQERLIWLQLSAEAVNPVGIDGALASAQADVVALAEVLCPEVFPALS
jgi:hypothetical protein